MKRLMVGDCVLEKLFSVSDPDAPIEIDFEASVVKALSCFYPKYDCIVFGGSFLHEGKVAKPDLALVAKDLSHWFVIEVELLSHSLEGHVLPQVRTLRYGSPQDNCAAILSRELGWSYESSRTFVQVAPRGTAVVANKRDIRWEQMLAGVPVQYLSLIKFLTVGGEEAVELEGTLEIDRRHLGFGTYSAADRSFRFPPLTDIPEGQISIRDDYGAHGVWHCRRDAANVWITKENGVPAIPDRSVMQLVKLADGPFALRAHTSQ